MNIHHLLARFATVLGIHILFSSTPRGCMNPTPLFASRHVELLERHVGEGHMQGGK